MLRILIVDDEYYFRQALKIELPWEDLGFELCGEAEDGEDALNKIQEFKPDIALVDVNMPVLDGLELARTIKEKGYNIKIIIVTGYSEFKYAKQAIEFGVNNYLLKPINRNELLESLQSVKAIIENEANVQFQINHLKKQVVESKPLLREKFLNDLISGNSLLQYKDIYYKAAYLNIEIAYGYFYVVAVQIDGIEEKGWSDNDKELWKYAVFNIVSEIMSSKQQCNICFDTGERICSIIGCKKPADIPADQAILSICDIIRLSVQKYLKFTVTIGIGNVHEKISSISLSYKESIFAIKNQLVIGNNRVIPYKTINESNLSANYFPVETKRNLLLCMRTNNKEEVSNILNNIFDRFKFSAPNTEIIYVHCIELISTCIEFAVECNQDTKTILKNIPDPFEEIYKLKKFSDIEQWIKSTFTSTLDSVHSNKKKRSSRLIDDVKKYVNDHYQNNGLRIDEIAKKFYINYHHLCSVFKKDSGITLNEYISSIRINRAKEMIDSGNISITEVAKLVGYDDPNYFSKCFKKTIGLSPQKYTENKNTRT